MQWNFPLSRLVCAVVAFKTSSYQLICRNDDPFKRWSAWAIYAPAIPAHHRPKMIATTKRRTAVVERDLENLLHALRMNGQDLRLATISAKNMISWLKITKPPWPIGRRDNEITGLGFAGAVT